jgi:DNA-binding NtrC family response regulator
MIYKANILVVDDDTTVCKSIARVLENEGYTVDMVFSGEEALEKASKNKYAVVLIDLMLPGLGGTEVLQGIKKQNPNITAIMITGYPSIKTAVESIKLSAFDYLPKPFTPDELCGMVARALERRLAYEEIAQQIGLSEEKLVEISKPNSSST